MFAKSLVCLSLLSILGRCSPTPTSDGRHPLESVHLTPAQVKSLCDSLFSSQIDNDQLYQWINVHKEKEQQKAEEKSKKTCFKIGFTPCVGEARYPLTKDCGFFSTIPANGEECSSRSKRSTSTKSVSLSHGEAQQLCHSFQTIPSSPAEINYVAIKINVMDPKDEKVQLPHPAEECVAWAYKPCMHQEQVDCDEWQKVVKPIEKCANFHSQDPAVHPQHPHRPKMDQTISNSSLSGMEHFITCKTTEDGAGVQCQITPVGTESKLYQSHARKKRQALGFDTSLLSDSTCPTPQCCCGYIDCECCCQRSIGDIIGPPCPYCFPTVPCPYCLPALPPPCPYCPPACPYCY